MLKTVFQKPVMSTFATTAMLTTAVITSSATNSNLKNNFITPEQTEIISKAGAEALKNNAYTLEVSSFKHNKDLDKLYLKNCDIEKSTKYKKSILKSLYNVYGTYGATIEIQREIDNASLKEAFDLYLNHYKLDNKTKIKAIEIIADFEKWQNDVYYTELLKAEVEMYKKIPYPNVEQAIKIIDEHINNSEFFTKEDIKSYHGNSKKYQARQEKKDSEKAKADLLAYKVHLLNTLAFNKILIKFNFPEAWILDYYFINEFINNKKSFIRPQ